MTGAPKEQRPYSPVPLLLFLSALVGIPWVFFFMVSSLNWWTDRVEDWPIESRDVASLPHFISDETKSFFPPTAHNIRGTLNIDDVTYRCRFELTSLDSIPAAFVRFDSEADTRIELGSPRKPEW